jgi:hypothetical protein
LINKHRRLVNRWKRRKNDADRITTNTLRKEIRREIEENKRTKVRKHIRPGNQKSLWDAVKVAKEEDALSMPTDMTIDEEKITKGKVAETFAKHFRTKVSSIIESTNINTGVFNGIKLFDAEDSNFMTEENVNKTLRGLKIKNCEGYDRIPLRVYNEGANYQTKTFNKIYNERKVLQQWKIAKVIPLYKKATSAKWRTTGPSQTYAQFQKYAKN